ncbi:Phosphoribosyl 1,2-cyclic phosphodiesterase [Thermodesulfobium acidiphilum]|uniref:Phosphoribosyl 1,2-cyclic phosphodiesterase n=1 Tax=Thermodesulfobium acidiphilum TaxID=1794699 RepID=A0A2R4VZD3_THEAF|nr:MBL fold metallo-hydrolase [Thermodesulfobium acidiphilum]AWB09800.1 Phosphoribosyl 1,2-cyclic phosphodiesterase [Thermodesulfobium acidiphilum]
MKSVELSVLASSSSGNSTLLRIGGYNFLIDVGVSCFYLKKALESLYLRIGDIDAVFITHEHTDHVKGLEVFMKNYNIPVFIREKCLYEVSRKVSCRNCFQILNDDIKFNDVKVSFFPTSHDAIDPIGYEFSYKDFCFSYITDLGEVTSDVKYAIDKSDLLVLESNHDIEMLKNGSYPYYLKKRILSSNGHLSNKDAAFALLNSKIKKRNIVLGHLSEKNNCIELLKKTYREIFGKSKLPFKIKIAKPREIVGLKINI